MEHQTCLTETLLQRRKSWIGWLRWMLKTILNWSLDQCWKTWLRRFNTWPSIFVSKRGYVVIKSFLGLNFMWPFKIKYTFYFALVKISINCTVHIPHKNWEHCLKINYILFKIKTESYQNNNIFKLNYIFYQWS